MVQILPSNTFTTAKWIVSATASDGTHTTIASALTSASSGDTIFIRPGTYTENLTLKAGVNLTAFPCDSSLNATGNVIISGTCTMTVAGSVTISGIQLQTNSAALLAVTGSAASIVNLNGCYLNCTNTTGITYSAANTSSAINLYRCNGNIGTTGISLATVTSTGSLTLYGTSIANSGAATTATTTSAASISLYYSTLNIAFSTSSTGILNFVDSVIDTSAINTTAMTAAGTGTIVGLYSFFSTGTASAISIGSGCAGNYNGCTFNSSNTNVLTGAGTINSSVNIYTGASLGDNVTTHSTVGAVVGLRGFTPSAGYLGERVTNTQTAGTPANNTPTTLTSISLTAGVWDISCIASFSFTGLSTIVLANISTTTNTVVGTLGDAYAQENYASSLTPVKCLAVPAFRVTITATTSYFLVVQNNFSTGVTSVNGRISAVRVG